MMETGTRVELELARVVIGITQQFLTIIFAVQKIGI